jgi:hypothetical protein
MAPETTFGRIVIQSNHLPGIMIARRTCVGLYTDSAKQSDVWLYNGRWDSTDVFEESPETWKFVTDIRR